MQRVAAFVVLIAMLSPLSACARQPGSTVALPPRTIALAALGERLLALTDEPSAKNAAVVARDGSVVRRFRVEHAADVAAAGVDAADFLVNEGAASVVERRAADGSALGRRRSAIRLDGLGPEVDGEPVGIVRAAAGLRVVRLDGTTIRRFAGGASRAGWCELGMHRYLVVAGSRGTSLFDPEDRSEHRAAIAGVDATCVSTRSGTVLAVIEKRGDRRTLAIAALPSLQRLGTLPLRADASRIVSSTRAAYAFGEAAPPAAQALRADSMDFREQLIHALVFK